MLLKLIHKVIIFLSCAVVILFIAVLFNLNNTFTNTNIELLYKKHEKNKKEKIYRNVIGRAIYLIPSKLNINLPSFREEIEVFKHTLRPDMLNRIVQYEIILKNNNQKVITLLDEKNYINSSDGKKFFFSSTPTDFWVVLSNSNNEEIKVDVVANVKNNLAESQQISDTFMVEALDESLKEKKEIGETFKILSQAKWWGEDLFLKYINHENKEKHRLEITPSNLIFIQERDLLIFKDNSWQKAGKEDISNYPIAQITSIDSRIIEIEAWSVSGEKKYSFAISPGRDQPSNNRMEEVITQPRMRTHLHVSCIMNKQRKVLKEKDILIKQENQWKYIKKEELQSPPLNEICILEKIEKKGIQKQLHVIVFNTTHTQQTLVELPLQNIKRTNSVNREIKR